MVLQFEDKQTKGKLIFTKSEAVFRNFFPMENKFLTIALNTGIGQKIKIDEIEFDFSQNAMLSLNANQTFVFKKPSSIITWQFDKSFYCIEDHDQEVGCAGFLFYGSTNTFILKIDQPELKKIQLLVKVFIEEFNTVDNIQGEMLRVLLKRLIIKMTRLAKLQFLDTQNITDKKLDVIRKFNLLVEKHYKEERQVKYYASLVNRSPKTLSNLFLLYNHKSPMQVIHERIIIEAKRLFNYTDKSVKEISFLLGFKDEGHFSRFFKNETGVSPSFFKKSI